MALARHVTFVHQTEGLELEEKHQEHDSDSDDDDDDTNNVGRNNHQNNSNTNNYKTDYDEEKDVVSPRLLREYISRAKRCKMKRRKKHVLSALQ
jgi:hypothetical protein